MWREVIDRPGAWPELSATAMIGTAMLRGVRHGWLPAGEYQPRIDRAWKAVAARAAPDGVLIDVCEGTGKQKQAGDYLRRAALLGRDPRGGAMALLFATEMAGLP
jgi:rhamnogalacturonyl hydrolase YesR